MSTASAAVQARFGGLIASGWHTAAMMMRLFVDNFLPTSASLGSPGIDELRWLGPVRPGDVLQRSVSRSSKRRARDQNPIEASCAPCCEVLNQNREVVMSLKAMNIIACRRPPIRPPLRGRGRRGLLKVGIVSDVHCNVAGLLRRRWT